MNSLHFIDLKARAGNFLVSPISTKLVGRIQAAIRSPCGANADTSVFNDVDAGLLIC